jgi:hypothetical protein
MANVVKGAESVARRGAASGYAPLDVNARVPQANLGTGSTGTGSRFLTDAQTYVEPTATGTSNGHLPASDYDIVGDGTNELTKVNNWIAGIATSGRPGIGILDSTSKTITVNGSIAVANNSFRLEGNGIRITTSAGSPTFPIINWTETGGGTGRGQNGWIRDLTIDPAAGSVVAGSVGIVANGPIGFKISGVRVLRCWIGFDPQGNPYGHTIENCWTDPGNVIYGLLVRRGSQSGNDNGYLENWFGGFRSAVFIEGQSGGFRFRGGQMTGGSGTTVTDQNMGIVTMNQEWNDTTKGGTGTASFGDVINVLFDGVSWEGSHDRALIRSFGKVTAKVTNQSNFNLDSGGQPLCDCVWRGTNMLDSIITIEDTHIYGYQQAANPLEFSGFSTTEGGLVDQNNWGTLNVSSPRTSEAGTSLTPFESNPLGNQSGLGLMPRTSKTPGKMWRNGTVVDLSSGHHPSLGYYAASHTGWVGALVALVSNNYYGVRWTPQRTYSSTSIGFRVTTASGTDDACEITIHDAQTGVRLATSGSLTGRLNSTGNKTASVAYTFMAGEEYYIGFVAASTATLVMMSTGTFNLSQMWTGGPSGGGLGELDQITISGWGIGNAATLAGSGATQNVPAMIVWD